MAGDDRVYVGQMLEMASKAHQLVQDKDRAAYNADEVLRLALTHLIQIIGEAARHVSAAYQADHPAIPWSIIIGMRHKVVHDYMGVDEDVVWETVNHDLPELIKLLRIVVPPDEPAA